MNISKFLKEERLKKGLSQGEIAHKLGFTSPQFISNIERGLAFPPVDKLKKIATLLGLDVELLVDLYFEDKKEQILKKLKKVK